jgi:hypothetical protein
MKQIPFLVENSLKNGFPQTPFQESRKGKCCAFSNAFLSPFSEGDWGNRSLGSKERFPQKIQKLKIPFSLAFFLLIGYNVASVV